MSPLNVAVTAALVFFASPVAARTASAVHAPAAACSAGLHPAATAELFFGRNIGQTTAVSDQDWQSFVDREITPRFPDGLSVFDVYGQYRGPGGEFVREPTKALLLVFSGTSEERDRIHAIRDAYRDQFRQESVMLLEQSACVSF
jgi:hypothetical protein